VEPPVLAVSAVLPDVVASLSDYPNLVVEAPPGSGKTTLLPLALLDAPWCTGRVIVLEPRRLATRAAARRMASLRGEQVGETIGFRTRDERRVSAATRLEVVTEGIVTRWLQSDPELPGIDVLVFDEVHERNLVTDLGLALALDVQRSIRPDLRVVAMSATLDAGKLAGLLGGDDPAPIIRADGRPFAVEQRWMPLRKTDRLEAAVVNAVERAVMNEPGDVLVFLPGVGEITRVAAALLESPLSAGFDVRPLYGALSGAEQDAALWPSSRRRIVVSTDIAESSLTVEGVRIVVDSGLARAPRFDPRSGMSRLTTVSISRASADQRAGRAGRTEPGVVYRLWSKVEHGTRRAQIEPEIAQVDLCGFGLELAAWGVDDPKSLPLLDQPSPGALAEARGVLRDVGAIDDSLRITDHGRALLALPVHPRLGHMIVRARDEGRGWLACIIATLLDERDVLRGHPDEVPVDLSERVALVVDERRSRPGVDVGALRTVRQRARDLARRVAVNDDEPVVLDACGEVLAGAYPDRLAIRRGAAGRFRMRSGTAVWVTKGDPVGQAEFVVCATTDGHRRESRLRVAAPIDRLDVADRFGHLVETRRALQWEGDRLIDRLEERIDEIVLRARELPMRATPEVTAALLDRVRERGLSVLPWTQTSTSLVKRLQFAARHDVTIGDVAQGDWSEASLVASLDTWLSPFLLGATGWHDVEMVDVTGALTSQLAYDQRQRLDELVPEWFVSPVGRRHRIDYTDAGPEVSLRVQDVYGQRTHPAVLNGRVPIRLVLLSPAQRPIQITSDLPGLWSGSWAEIRKDMAGRYPKHSWPTDPTVTST
jgi:ATP-dependent helicase HrpB